MDILKILESILPLTLAYTAPLLIIAIGGLVSERSGVVNIGLEGLMGMGAFFCAYFIFMTQDDLGSTSIWLGLLISAVAGGIFSLLHAFASITMKSDQVISGTAINILSLALTVYLANAFTKSSNIPIEQTLSKNNISILGINLGDIPIIGLFFKDAYVTTYLVIALVFITWFILYKRPFGLRLRACGENPHAADSLGINVIKIRYIGVFVSGLLAGLGGGILIVTVHAKFSISVFSGMGFLALAALIFGKWNPWGVLGASFFFGFATTVANMSELYDSLKSMPNIIFNTFPYVMTLIALVIFSKNSSGPKAAGEPYDSGKR